MTVIATGRVPPVVNTTADEPEWQIANTDWTSINPAPCTDAIRNDHNPSPANPADWGPA